jgi:hypothetical protein
MQMKKFNLLVNQPAPQADQAKNRREQFVQANASAALEGLVATDVDLHIQELVIFGKLTPDQAVAECIALAKQGK